MAQDKSGPAFPCPAPIINGNGDPIYTDQPGMTLRDWFAGQALAGLTTNGAPDFKIWLDVVAQAYSLADAMLQAREA